MKKVVIASLIGVMVLGIGILFAAPETKGNGAPNGQHENINIIGVNNEKNENYTGGNGSVIFVKRTGTTQFYVHGGTSFAILDHDGTDGKVGTGLTDPGLVFPYDAGASPTWRVQIWVRLLGPKGSEVHWTSYYYDTVGATYVLWDEFTLKKDGAPKFTERTSDLLADGYQDMLWELDPVTKFRLCQMRIFLLD
jgi:hypothetical protein